VHHRQPAGSKTKQFVHESEQKPPCTAVAQRRGTAHPCTPLKTAAAAGANPYARARAAAMRSRSSPYRQGQLPAVWASGAEGQLVLALAAQVAHLERKCPGSPGSSGSPPQTQALRQPRQLKQPSSNTSAPANLVTQAAQAAHFRHKRSGSPGS